MSESLVTPEAPSRAGAALLDAALGYAKRGWPVLPLHSVRDGRCSCGDVECSSQGKHPRTSHGLKDATTDEAKVREWWARWPNANIGVVAGRKSGIVVIDIDSHPALDTLKAFVDVPATLTVRTSRGWHYYLQHPASEVRSRKIFDGVDLRSEGTYVVAPPSVHATGHEYAFEAADHSIAQAPASLLRVMNATPAVDPSHAGVLVPGERNSSLTSIGGTLVRNGIVGPRLDRVLEFVNEEVCHPPLGATEVERTARSVERYKDVQPTSPTMSTGWAQPQTTPNFTLLSVDELLELKPPEWLIEGLIETRAFGVHFGPSACGKSFVALDWALSIATGREWFGRKVMQGPVIYVVGEGTSGAHRRVRAWMDHRRVDSVSDAFFLLQAPHLMNGVEVTGLADAVHQRCHKAAALIVIDTLARSFVGGEENSAKDMGLFVDGCQELQALTGATVLVLHHAGKPKGNKVPPTERGSSALRAAADVVIAQTKRGDIITVENEKQKDDEAFPTIKLRLQRVELGTDDTTGKQITSCVLIPTATVVDGQRDDSVPIPNDAELNGLEILADLASEATSGEWHQKISDMREEKVPEKTFHNWRKSLLEKQLIVCIDQTKHLYRCTARGIEVVATAKAAKRQPQAANGSR